MPVKLLSSKGLYYALMCLVVCAWGFDYIVAKNSLEIFSTFTLVFVKYGVAFIVVLIVKLVTDRKFRMRKRDLAFLALCALFGDVFYYGGEYGSMAYLPVSVVSIILAFVPVLSIILEAVLYRRAPTVLIVLGVIFSILGVGLVVGSDLGDLIGGKLPGYLLAFSAVICWNAYNFLTDRMTGNYKPLDIVLCQLLAAVLITSPYALSHMPPSSAFTPTLIVSLLYLGGFSSGVCFLIYVNALKHIGVTPTALFSNLLPVTTTIFGIIFLKESITTLQLAGGVLVILASSVVIYLKNRQDARLQNDGGGTHVGDGQLQSDGDGTHADERLKRDSEGDERPQNGGETRAEDGR